MFQFLRQLYCLTRNSILFSKASKMKILLIRISYKNESHNEQKRFPNFSLIFEIIYFIWKEYTHYIFFFDL